MEGKLQVGKEWYEKIKEGRDTEQKRKFWKEKRQREGKEQKEEELREKIIL